VSEDRREAFYQERMREHGPRYPEFDLLATETAVSLLYTYDLFHQTVSRYLAEFGLSKSTFNILMVLWHAKPEGVLLHDLGELLLVSRANITGLMDHLEEKGYVKRVVDAHDRRARFARLTRKGEELLDQYAPVHYRNIAELLKDLTAEDKETLIMLLKKMRSSLNNHAPESSDYVTEAPRATER
jgi:MarR family transcriptional regulator, 2-MHQ and catechol-resistance regulon repressor